MDNAVVTPMQPGETAVAATMLSHAFLGCPNTVAMGGGKGENVRQCLEVVFRIAKLEKPFANVIVARQAGRIVGACNAVEYPKCQGSPLASLGVLPAMLKLGLGAMMRGMKVQATMTKHHPREHHWHVGPIGVLPELQGKGIGSLLLTRSCEIVDERKAAAYLETDKPENVRLYERFGFVVIGETDVLGVHQWFMRRAPR